MTDASGRGAPLALIMCLCTCLVAPGASAREPDTSTRTFGNDVFMAGSNVRVADGSAGDAILAGGWISSSGVVQGDEVATGGLLGGTLRFLLIIAGIGSVVLASAARHRAAEARDRVESQ